MGDCELTQSLQYSENEQNQPAVRPKRWCYSIKTLVAALIIGLLVCLAIICAMAIDSRKPENSAPEKGTSATIVPRPTTARPGTTPRPTWPKSIPSKVQISPTRKAEDQSPVFGHFEPSYPQGTGNGDFVQWSIKGRSWTSHDIYLQNDNTEIVVDRRGIYRCSVSFCVSCDNKLQPPADTRVELIMLENSKPVMKLYARVAGETLADSILLDLREGDRVSVRISRRYWSPSQQAVNHLDINLVSSKTFSVG